MTDTTPRTVEKRETDLIKLSEMYLTGHRICDISEEIGVHRETIRRDIKELHKRWKETQLNNLDEFKAKELAKIDELEVAAWEGWRRSVGKMTKMTHDKGQGGHGPIDKKKGVVWHEAGDVKFLDTVMKCVEKRCKILGLDAPEKNETKFVDEFSNMSLEDLEKEEKKIDETLSHNRIAHLTNDGGNGNGNGNN